MTAARCRPGRDPAAAQLLATWIRSEAYGASHSATGKRVIEEALQEAGGLGHDYGGTEHILLAALREPDGLCASLRDALGLAYEPILRAVRDLPPSSGPPPG